MKKILLTTTFIALPLALSACDKASQAPNLKRPPMLKLIVWAKWLRQTNQSRPKGAERSPQLI